MTTANWGSINWTVNLGDNAALPLGGDQFTVDNSLNIDNDIKTDWGVNGVDLNGDGNLDVALVSVEKNVGHRRAGHGQRHGEDDEQHDQRRWLHHHRRGLPDGHHDRRRGEPHVLPEHHRGRRQRHAHGQRR